MNELQREFDKEMDKLVLDEFAKHLTICTHKDDKGRMLRVDEQPDGTYTCVWCGAVAEVK